MRSIWYIWLVVFILLLIYLPRKRRRKAKAKQYLKYKKKPELRRKELLIMKELVSRLVDKDVYIKLLEGHADGVIKEVTDNGIVIENKDGLQIVNLEYVLKIREFPYKNGKRALILDE